ncbi:UNVERIFIED_CONTAM: hypothetical protein FKN15_019478 [Acipenser sinensis]
MEYDIIIVAEETLKTDEETVITHEEGVLQDYSRNNDKDDFRKLAGKRAGSHPNLLDISKGWDSEQRGRSNEKFQNQSRTPRVNNLDYRALKKIFEMEPSEVVMKLASPGSGLKEFLSHEDMTDELIAIALEVLGILYRVQFGIDNLKSVNWESSKRLLYGALVCLSRDNFETMIFATVANRDVKDLQKGITTLDFTEESRLKLSEFQENDYFLMVETTAFFEAYRHVLGGLKEMALGELPMQKYIVSCDTDISAPQYLMNHPHTYSLQSLTTEGPVRIQELEKSVSTEESDDSDISDTDELLGLPWKDRHDVLNFADWPSKQRLKLDDSQLQAVQMALTKELAIIQGPPGTGKTYIGLKIVKTILSNSNTWRSMGGCPILVVCYTNHALDQFLEGIHKFLRTGLVRVGGRCASEVLQKFSLNNLRRHNMFKQNLPGHLRAMYSVLTENRKSVEEKIQKKAALFESAAKGVLHENVLEDIIISLHGTNLGDVQNKHILCLSEDRADENLNKPGIGEWKSYADDVAKAAELLKLADTQEEEDASETASVTTEGDENAADLLAVTEEADLVQAERMIEDDDVQKQIQQAKRRIFQTKRVVLAYVPGEEKEEVQSKNEPYDEGWEITKDMKKKLKRIVKVELLKTDHMLEEEAEQIANLWTLSYTQRWHLYRIVIIFIIIKIFFYICWYRSRQRQLDAYLSNPRNAQIVIVGGRAYLHQMCERQNTSIWPSWYGVQDDVSVGEPSGSVPPAPAYSHVDVPPPYEAVSDDLKPPPYSEYSPREEVADSQAIHIPENYEACSISDAPPPYTLSSLTEAQQQDIAVPPSSQTAASTNSPGCQTQA